MEQFRRLAAAQVLVDQRREQRPQNEAAVDDPPQPGADARARDQSFELHRRLAFVMLHEPHAGERRRGVEDAAEAGRQRKMRAGA